MTTATALKPRYEARRLPQDSKSPDPLWSVWDNRSRVWVIDESTTDELRAIRRAGALNHAYTRTL